MKILISNLGSTSFKFRLFHFEGEKASLLAKGGYERVTDYGKAIDTCIAELTTLGHRDIDAVGFKTVLGENLTGCVTADEKVDAALLAAADLAPAHNPPYAEGIRQFRQKLPGVPLVALFETAFYQWVHNYAARYAVPDAWHAAGLRRHGFHGASHKFVAERSAELLGRDDIAAMVRHLYQSGPRPIPGAELRVISCHLGGSSSVTGICDGLAIGSSMGLSPQSGLPQNNRVGDLDAAAFPFLRKRLGLTCDEINRQLSNESGLRGLSGCGGDIRDIRDAAVAGDRRAELALDIYVHSIRHWIGAFWFELGGCDALVFTGGIGENNTWLREMVCAGLADLGLILDPFCNAALPPESDLAASESRTHVMVIPANEELVVARETRRHLLAACPVSV